MLSKTNTSTDTNICAFLQAVPNLKVLNEQSIIKLSERFTVSPESFALLISIAVNGGANCEN